MQNKFSWLTRYEVIELNADAVSRTGEPFSLIDPNKLDGALQRPINLNQYGGEESVSSLAISYLFAIAEAHAFMQGNKRTGFAAANSFLINHGYQLSVPDIEFTSGFIKRVLTGEASMSDFCSHFEYHVEDLQDDYLVL